MRPAIRVENLSKLYRLGAHASRGYGTLRESITHTLQAPWRWVRRRARLLSPSSNGHARPAAGPPSPDTIWAVKDVSFDVQPGEVVGIIGRNGAGKSTLLKILSRITEPTAGRVQLQGRVGSLLEVGTGFHPELSGRENIYLNGAILGMSRREIAAKFDEIVAFSDIERFLDTPVKRYSSGMFVRLGFAVASHMETEILIVDEVLAVGDVAFQRKCLGKMREVSSGGRTVLFVSHNMAAVRALCSRAIMLNAGQVSCLGDAASVTDAYLQSQAPPENVVQPGLLPCFCPAKDLGVMAASLTRDDSDLQLKVAIHTTRRFPLIGIGYAIKTLGGTCVVHQGPNVSKITLHDLTGSADVTVTLRDAVKLLNGGTYFLDLWVSYPGIEYIIRLDQLIRFDLPEQDPYGSGLALTLRTHGPLCLVATYQEQREANNSGMAPLLGEPGLNSN
jgi:lipopolysaccharide transport system ATP-binding protein